MKKFFYLSFVFLLFFTLLINECKKDNKLKIGIITNFSGPNGGTGISLISSIDKTLKEYGFSNYEFIIANDSWSSEKIDSAISEVLSDKPDILILGTTSTALLQVFDRLEELKIPVISLSSTTTKITKLDDNIFSFALNLKDEQKQIAEEFNRNHWEKAFVIIETSNYKYTFPAFDYFKKFYKGKIEEVFKFKSGDLNINEFKQVIESKGANFDSVYFLVGYSFEAGIMVQIIKNYYNDLPMMITPWAAENLEIFAGKRLKNVIIAHYYDIYNDKFLKNYINKYKRIFNTMPTILSLLGREASCLINDVYKRYHSIDVKYFKKHLNEENGINYSFDRYGDSRRKLYFIKIYKNEQ